jgi:hypothetical protein
MVEAGEARKLVVEHVGPLSLDLRPKRSGVDARQRWRLDLHEVALALQRSGHGTGSTEQIRVPKQDHHVVWVTRAAGLRECAQLLGQQIDDRVAGDPGGRLRCV